MDIKQCDLCGFRYDIYEVNRNYENYSSYEGEMRFTKLANSKTMFSIDVCPNCFDGFYEAINKVVEDFTKESLK